MRDCEADRLHRRRTVSWRAGVVAGGLCFYILAPGGISQAGGFTSPKECQAFVGDDHLTCLYGYIERQQKHNDTVESRRKAQQDMLEEIGTGGARVDQHPAEREQDQVETVDRKDLSQAAPAPSNPSERMTPTMGSPVECRAYAGAAHVNCLYAYIEIQNSKAGHVEEELKAQKHMLGQLRDQMDRQAAASQDLQRRLAERDAISSSFSAYVAPMFPGYAYPGFGYLGYGYPGYAYPAPGISLYLGVPGYYWGRPFYGPRFFGPRFYGRHRR